MSLIERNRGRYGPGEPRLALSIVIPVYNGAGSIAELVGALENLPIAGGHEIVLVMMAAQTTASPSARR